MSLQLLGRASSGRRLLTRALSGRRRVIGIAVQRVLGGAVSLGLLTRASCGWRCALRLLGSAGEQKRLILKGRACRESSFLGFGSGPGFGEVQNGSFETTGLVQNRQFSALVRVRACGEAQNSSFLEAGLVQNIRHF